MASHRLDPDPGQDCYTALPECRERWRAFGALAADLAFETDGDGRLAFIAPDGVLMLGAGETALGQTDAFVSDFECRGLYRPTIDGGVTQRVA